MDRILPPRHPAALLPSPLSPQARTALATQQKWCKLPTPASGSLLCSSAAQLYHTKQQCVIFWGEREEIILS